MYPWGLPERSDSSSSSGDEEESEDVRGRLEALERSNRRIEEMLGRLCAEMVGVHRPASGGTGGTGTLHDLDRTLLAELTDGAEDVVE